ncbi:MAG: sugar ABC transporter substrate-binding protein [Anaerolineae bacterium]|nr:sugar ABC transporter substrate-binding protein [Anaerolineae bacterium]
MKQPKEQIITADSQVEALKHKIDHTQPPPVFAPVSTPVRAVTKTKTSRRIFLRWGTFAAAGAVLSACNSTSPLTPFSAQPETPEKIQLVYQDWRTEWFPPMVQQLLAEFHESHPHIHVFYTPDPENLEEKMLADLQAGSAPDIFEGCCDFFPIWAQQGYALDLRPYVEADLDQATIADWNPAQYRSFFTRDGRQYGLPKYHGALALYFNKDIFDQYGVEYPTNTWTYADYLAAMRQLTHDRDGDGQTDLWGSMVDITWDRLQLYANGWGGHFVDPQNPTRCRMAEPEALAGLEWLRARMWDDRVMASFLDVQNLPTRQAFVAEKLAMVEDGSWALKDILAGANFRVGVAPFPAGPVRRFTLATTDGFGIYAGTKYPEAAWELIKFLISKDYGRAMARASFLQPARASLIDEWVGFVRQEFPEKARDVDLVAFADGHLKGYSVTAEIFANQAEAKQITDAAWHQIFTLGQAPVSIMEEACRQIQAAQAAQK